jgi:hypothetical protein
MKHGLEKIWKETVVAWSRYYPVIFVEELRKTMKSPRIANVPAEIPRELQMQINFIRVSRPTCAVTSPSLLETYQHWCLSGRLHGVACIRWLAVLYVRWFTAPYSAWVLWWAVHCWSKAFPGHFGFLLPVHQCSLFIMALDSLSVWGRWTRTLGLIQVPCLARLERCELYTEFAAPMHSESSYPMDGALCYKPEGRGFDSRWGHWIFQLTWSWGQLSL